ncbi:hypothetical protein JXQ70_12510 [bacterium]|nr:hypothetical protein [bacterium]
MKKERGESPWDFWYRIKISRMQLALLIIGICVLTVLALLVYYDKIAFFVEWRVNQLEQKIEMLIEHVRIAGAEPQEIENFHTQFQELKNSRTTGLALIQYRTELDNFVTEIEKFISALKLYQKGYLARIARIIRQVTVNLHDQLSWSDARIGLQLSSGDKVKTGLDSRAEITTDSGNVLSMNPSSMIIIKDLSRDRTSFKPREVYSIKETDEADFNIRTRNSDIMLNDENAEIKIMQKSEISFKKKQKVSTISVFQGLVEIKNNQGQTREVKTREALQISHLGTFETQLEIPYPPELLDPPNLKFFRFASENEARIEFSWAKRENINVYHLQIANDIDFNDLLVNLDINGLSYTLSGPKKGNYFWRLSSISPVGSEIRSEFSSKQSFLVSYETEALSQDITPPTFSKLITRRISPSTLLIEGQTEPGARLVVEDITVKVKEDGSFSDIIPLPTSGASKVDLQLYDRAGNVYRKRISLL